MVKRLSGVLAALVLVLGVAACGSESDGSAAPGGSDGASAGASDTPSDTPAADQTHAAQPTDPDGVACEYGPAQPAATPVDPPAPTAAYNGTVAATLQTSAGDIDVTLDAAAAPCTVNSFTSLASQGYFDGTTCHRLTTEGIFVLQCGDPTGAGTGGPGYSFADELTGAETYGPGTLAMANAGPNTNGSQFFLVYGDSPLPASYTVFGSVGQAGLDVLTSIADKGTADGSGDGAPAEPVTLDFVSIGDATPGTTPSSTAPVQPSGCTYTPDGSGSAKLPPVKPAKGMIDATISTSAGSIPITLDATSAPCTVNSFTSLTKQGYFDNTMCHRLTTEGIFVLQCGDPTATGTGGPGYSFADELSGTESYGPGTLAMANAGPNTNGSQFFMVFGDSPLPPSYTVFGSISKAGLAVVKKVGDAGVKGGGGDGAPKTPVTITKVTLR
ncbi:hypothetical protein BH11ACT8_BH11ACT8_21130 [soil metagenome]